MDCGFENGDGWFRYRAAAIIIEDGCVLFAKNELDSYYYSIGGGVHLGEKAEDALIFCIKKAGYSGIADFLTY